LLKKKGVEKGNTLGDPNTGQLNSGCIPNQYSDINTWLVSLSWPVLKRPVKSKIVKLKL
jgi:hypothetical protein